MRVGVPKEIKDHEDRVDLVPSPSDRTSGDYKLRRYEEQLGMRGRAIYYDPQVGNPVPAMTTNTLVSRLNSLLSPIGFMRKGYAWNREVDTFTDVIDIQPSKFDQAFTLNAAVAHRKLYKLCWGREAPEFMDEPMGIVRSRVGELIDNKDLWWPLGDVSGADDAVDKTLAYIVPFLNRAHSLEAIERFLVTKGVEKQSYPLPVIYLALVRCELGDKPACCELLCSLNFKTPPSWKSNIEAVMVRIGCSL
jgi:hypothetical protein